MVWGNYFFSPNCMCRSFKKDHRNEADQEWLFQNLTLRFDTFPPKKVNMVGRALEEVCRTGQSRYVPNCKDISALAGE